MEDVSLVRKSEIYVDVLNSYIRALRSLSSESRWKSYGTEIRGIGNRVDSVVYRFNRLDAVSEEVPEGYARLAGKVLGYARNSHTAETMNKAGFEIIRAADVIDGKVDIARHDKFFITLDVSELARGGGGLRCMTMPVHRDDI